MAAAKEKNVAAGINGNRDALARRKEAAQFTDWEEQQKDDQAPLPVEEGRLLRDLGGNGLVPGTAGSMEQQLDMNEEGSLRGDDILFSHAGSTGDLPHRGGDDEEPLDTVDLMNRSFNIDLSEPGREGDEMSGDDHSSGMQGGETELKNQPHLDSGVPGDGTEEQELTTEAWEKHRIA